MLTATHSPWGLQQVVSFGFPTQVGIGVNGADTHKIDLRWCRSVFAGNITTGTVCWGGSWALISQGRANEAGKKTLRKQFTGMNIFVTKKWQLFLHPWDLCLLLLQAGEALIFLQSALQWHDRNKRDVLDLINPRVLKAWRNKAQGKLKLNWRGIYSTSSSF